MEHHSMQVDIRKKKIIVFDLDGTLTETKSPMDAQMSRLLSRLLEKKTVAVIGGGKYALFKEQLLRRLRTPKKLLKNLFLFPTTATAFYRYRSGWKRIYYHGLSKKEKRAIRQAFPAVFKEIGYVHPKQIYGELIEDRGTQMSFSVFGQDIVAVLGEKGIRLKKEWKRKYTPLKLKMAKLLAKRLPNLEVRAAGYTTIDVTRKGIDKAYGIRQIKKYLQVPIAQMVFVGDALFPGGNDFAARRTGVKCIAVSGPKEVKRLIRSWLSPVRSRGRDKSQTIV